MDRPSSVASSSPPSLPAAAKIGSSQHKRQASSVASAKSTARQPAPPSSGTATSAAATTTTTTTTTTTKPFGPSVLSLFVSNLRLLDLDLLPDWPAITVQSLGHQDGSQRIKGTEYALYQLFRLHDPGLAADKLQPFFPPLEPRQSANLRAALYRCLTELKKSGVLPRDAVLRKTMLDECQGEKFWETCLLFSALLVRKQTLGDENRKSNGSKKHSTVKPVAEQLGFATALSKADKESMLPLAIAHRAALARLLRDKKAKRQKFADLGALLAGKDAELQQRQGRVEQNAPPTVNASKLAAVELAVEKSWVGRTELKDALIGGDVAARGDGVFLTSFDDFWNFDGDARDPAASDFGIGDGFLEALGKKANEQSIRFRRWQNFHDKLLASKPRPTHSSNRSSVSDGESMRFDRHREITVSDSSPSINSSPVPTRHQRHDSVLRYDEILTTMREELRKNVVGKNGPPSSQPIIPPLKRAQTQPAPQRKSSRPGLEVSPGGNHRRSPSQTAVPMRPKMGIRVPSRSRSYQQPKVVSQKQPIPLKSELFSPLKDGSRSSNGGSSVLASPMEEDEEDEYDTPRKSKIDSVLGERAPSVATTTSSDQDNSASGGSNLPVGHDSADSTSESDKPEPGSMPDNTEVKSFDSLPVRKLRFCDDPLPSPRPSLAERTRMSMAFDPDLEKASDAFLLDSESNVSTPEEPQGDQTGETKTYLPTPPATSSNPSSVAEGGSHSHAPSLSLAERTRQSISSAPVRPSRAASRADHKTSRSRTSIIYPVNQFETPQKPGVARPTPNLNDAHDEGFATPPEKLMSPDAEYESVFKSRPRIAMSPVVNTPFGSRDGEERLDS